ncbi:MAG: hypothetical protein ACRDRH_13390 [Pseudonocardia sp.]
MISAAVVTIIGALLTVLVLAAYLIYVALVLRRVDGRLSAITAGVESITYKAELAGPIVREINKDLTGVNNALQAVLTKKRPPKRKPEPEPDLRPTAAPASDPTRPAWVVAPRVDPFNR